LFSFDLSEEKGMGRGKVDNYHSDVELKTYVQLVPDTGLTEVDVHNYTERLLVGFEGTTDKEDNVSTIRPLMLVEKWVEKE
jgi:hypothetical protein